MKRREYLKEYRQKNKSKLNDYHKKYYHSKKKKEEKEDKEEIKSIDLGNNKNDNSDNDKDNNSDNDKDNNSDSDKNNNSDDDDNNEKEHYIKVSYIIEEMNSLKDELETTLKIIIQILQITLLFKLS